MVRLLALHKGAGTFDGIDQRNQGCKRLEQRTNLWLYMVVMALFIVECSHPTQNGNHPTCLPQAADLSETSLDSILINIRAT